MYVHDSAIKGGAVSPWAFKKALRLQEVALENRLPMITLAESAGGNPDYQSELFVPGGQTFANQAVLQPGSHRSQLSTDRPLRAVPMCQVSQIMCIMVRKKAKVFLAGPPVV